MATKSEKKRAQALVDLEFGPQAAQVRNLWGKTRAQYLNDLSGARQTERAITTAAAAADPKIRTIYHDARADLGASNSFVDKARATMAPGPETGLTKLIGEQMARERGSALNANTAARAGALTELTNRASAAVAGKAAAYKTAKDTLTANRKDLTQQLSDLTGQKSSKMAALLGEMQGERSAANAKARGDSNKTIMSGDFAGLTQGQVDAMSTEDRLDWINKKAKKSKGKDNRATNDQRLQLSNAFGEAFDEAKNWSNLSRPQLAQLLIHGQTAGKDPVTKQPIMSVKKFGQLEASLALDMARDGHISRANAKKLHDLGYKTTDLTGATSYQDWIKTPAGRAWLAKQKAAKSKPKPKPKQPLPRGPFNPFGSPTVTAP